MVASILLARTTSLSVIAKTACLVQTTTDPTSTVVHTLRPTTRIVIATFSLRPSGTSGEIVTITMRGDIKTKTEVTSDLAIAEKLQECSLVLCTEYRPSRTTET